MPKRIVTPEPMLQMYAVTQDCSTRLPLDDYLIVADQLGSGGSVSLIYPDGNPAGQLQTHDMSDLQIVAHAAALVAYAEAKT